MSNDEIYLQYVGKGRGTIFGVPARDLTVEEAEIHGSLRLVNSGLYKYSDTAKAEIKTTRRTRALKKISAPVKESE